MIALKNFISLTVDIERWIDVEEDIEVQYVLFNDVLQGLEMASVIK